MPKLSILTPTIRPKALDITEQTLEKQDFKDFEWIVEVSDPKDGCDLSASYNRMLKKAKGDIIVSLQDYTRLNSPDFLSKVHRLHRMSKNERTAITYPVGKVDSFNQGDTEWDWRGVRENASKIHPHEWEIDLASASRLMFLEVGGFDEEFDNGWSWENVDLAYRASLLGWNFMCYNKISGTALRHDNIIPHPFRGKNENRDLVTRKKSELKQGRNPKLRYL